MKRRFICTFWNLEKIEKKIDVLEENGWRLNKVGGLFSFEFVSSVPKKVQYFFTYSIPRNKLNMHIIEGSLTSNFGGNKIKGNFFEGIGTTNIFRITKQVNLTEQKLNRAIVLSYCFFQKMLLDLLFLASFLPLLIYMIINPINFFTDINVSAEIFIWGYLLFFTVRAIYNLIGFVYQKRRALLLLKYKMTL